MNSKSRGRSAEPLTAVGRYVSILTVNDSDDNHAASDQDTLTVTITVRPKPE